MRLFLSSYKFSCSESQKMNVLMARLTVVATLVLPANAVTGMWGMNVPVPGRDEETLGPFLGIVGSILTIIVVMYFLFQRMQRSF